MSREKDRIFPSSGSSSMVSNFGGTAVTSAAGFVAAPIADAKSQLEGFHVMEFWHDMDRRERTFYHKATVILGVLQTVLVFAYVATVELKHKSHVDYRYLNFILAEVFIGGLFQSVYSVRGICLENSSVLLISNLNSIALAIRIGVSITAAMEEAYVDVGFTVVYAVLAMCHILTSFVAWGGEFNRFMMFCVSTDIEIQKLFRQYQLMLALSSFDIQFCVMTSAVILFFVEVHWWHYVLVSCLLFVNLAAKAAVRRSVRSESLTHLAYVIPIIYVGYAVFMVAAILDPSVLNVHINDDCKNTAYLTTALFVIVRLCFFASLVRCVNSFGEGMKRAFENQKSAGDYLKSIAATRYRPRFLPASSSMKAGSETGEPLNSDGAEIDA
jgi:hypothetical protein